MRIISLLLVSGLAAPAATVFYDTTFNNADWSGISVLDGSGSANSSTGAPLSTRSVGLTVQVGLNALAGEVNTVQLFTPTSVGGATALAFSFTPYSDTAYPLEEWGFLLRQQGSYYASPGILSFPTSVGSILTGSPAVTRTLTALDFGKVGTSGTGGANPDWSTGGGPIEIGYYLRFTNNSPFDPRTYFGYYDNLRVETVPEPQTFALAGVALVTLLRFGRARR